jgi:hypothetical protein
MPCWDELAVADCKVADGETTAMHLIIKAKDAKPLGASRPRAPTPSWQSFFLAPSNQYLAIVPALSSSCSTSHLFAVGVVV